MSCVIGSKQDALEIQRAVQNFIKEELKLDMKEQKGLILSAKSQMFSYIPFDWNLCISLFTLHKLKNMSMEDVCNFNYHLVLAYVPKPIFAHQVHIRES